MLPTRSIVFPMRSPEELLIRSASVWCETCSWPLMKSAVCDLSIKLHQSSIFIIQYRHVHVACFALILDKCVLVFIRWRVPVAKITSLPSHALSNTCLMSKELVTNSSSSVTCSTIHDIRSFDYHGMPPSMYLGVGLAEVSYERVVRISKNTIVVLAGEMACIGAAKYGHLDVLQWLRQNRCNWN